MTVLAQVIVRAVITVILVASAVLVAVLTAAHMVAVHTAVGRAARVHPIQIPSNFRQQPTISIIAATVRH